MAGLALLARESGFSVTGSDRNIYPPMSTQLLNSDIPLVDGYDAEQLSPEPGCVVVGNALSRGQPVVEAMLNSGIPYTCLLYTSPSPRDAHESRMPSSA